MVRETHKSVLNGAGHHHAEHQGLKILDVLARLAGIRGGVAEKTFHDHQLYPVVKGGKP